MEKRAGKDYPHGVRVCLQLEASAMLKRQVWRGYRGAALSRWRVWSWLWRQEGVWGGQAGAGGPGKGRAGEGQLRAASSRQEDMGSAGKSWGCRGQLKKGGPAM